MAKSKNKITLDSKAGSLAYNRLDFQVSHAMHLAIELYDTLDYLLVMDYYDDIALIHDETEANTISYYQIKTNEESISINTAISEDWLAKLYLHFDRPEFLVKELGLVTNCPLRVTNTILNENGNPKKTKQKYVSDKTAFSKFNIETLEKIKKDIADKTNKNIDDIDLSNFVHIRTTLSIDKHKDIVEKELTDFLYAKQPKITLDVVKTINSSMIEILTKRQSCETVSDTDDFTSIVTHKGVSKKDFTRIIKAANMIAIPPFTDIEQILSFGDEKYSASYEYTKLLEDSQKKSHSFLKIFTYLSTECSNAKLIPNQMFFSHINTLCDKLYESIPIYEALYNRTYLQILIVCILLNAERNEI